jgi:hypothetical protein
MCEGGEKMRVTIIIFHPIFFCRTHQKNLDSCNKFQNFATSNTDEIWSRENET